MLVNFRTENYTETYIDGLLRTSCSESLPRFAAPIFQNKEDFNMEQNKSTDLLLVIDMQNVYTNGQEWACEGVKQASDSILRLLNSRTPGQVIFTRYLASGQPEGVWKEYNEVNASINADPWLNEMMPEFLPWTSQYPVYSKSVYSSFGIPEVAEAARHADHVLISGVVAECCVLSTVLSAIDAGCKVIYLTDAVAGLSENSQKETENIISYFAPLHTKLMTTEEYIQEFLLKNQQPRQ